MARQPKHPEPEWAPCPSGRLALLSQQIHKRRQRRRFLQTTPALTGTVATGAGAWLGWAMMRRDGLTCVQVQRLATEYRQGKLDEAIQEQVRQHLARCPKCDAMYRTMGSPT